MNSSNSVWIALLVVWIAGSTWWHVCKIKLLCHDPAPVAEAEVTPAIPPLHVMDGAALMLTAPTNFSFAKSGYQVNTEGLGAVLDSVGGYLKSLPDKRLIITGLYAGSETNTSSFPDLGIARAEAVKAYYVGKGIPASIFSTKSRLTDDLVFIRDSVWGGIDHTFIDALTLTENNLAEEQKFQDIFKPLDLYFNTGSTNYIETGDNQRFLEEAKLFLAQNKDKKLTLTGHTDNVGNAGANLKLSQGRAESVRDVLVKFGIPESQILVTAKGQTQPKASNDTPDGKAANRRVSIVVSQ